jgi:hypothetical protein
MSAARPLTLFERALYGRGELPGNVTVTACIEGVLDEATLRHALDRVQAKHPLLRCLIEMRGGRPWFVEHDAPPPLPLHVVERQGDDDWLDVSAHDLARIFDAQCEPLARLTWLRGGERSELILVCHHAIGDGRSLLLLLSELLALCGEPWRDIGRHEALPAFADLVPAAVRDDRRLQRGMRWRAALLRFALRAFARPRPPQRYGEVYREWWKLDEPGASRLAEQCRLQNVSAYVAVALALVRAFRAVCGARRIAQFRAPVDMRRFLPGIADDSLFAIAPTIVLRPGAHGGELDAAAFWRDARAMQAQMHRDIDRLAPSVYRTFLGMERLHDVFDRMTAYGRAQRAGRQVTLSHLGRVPLDAHYRGFRLRDVRGLSGLIGATPAHLVVTSRYAGGFDFVLASDEASLPRVDARAIRDSALATLAALAAPQSRATAAGPDPALPVEVP